MIAHKESQIGIVLDTGNPWKKLRQANESILALNIGKNGKWVTTTSVAPINKIPDLFGFFVYFFI